jgi:hypothetical protein
MRLYPFSLWLFCDKTPDAPDSQESIAAAGDAGPVKSELGAIAECTCHNKFQGLTVEYAGWAIVGVTVMMRSVLSRHGRSTQQTTSRMVRSWNFKIKLRYDTGGATLASGTTLPSPSK